MRLSESRCCPCFCLLALRKSHSSVQPRGEETVESDLDILVRFAEPPRRPLSLITWGRLERELEQRCGRKVDLVSARGLSRHLRPLVEADKVILYAEA